MHVDATPRRKLGLGFSVLIIINEKYETLKKRKKKKQSTGLKQKL